MASLYFDLKLSNEQVATVSIRQMDLPTEGFGGTVYAYEIHHKGSPTPLRSTVTIEGPRDPLGIVLDVLIDHHENIGKFSRQ